MCRVDSRPRARWLAWLVLLAFLAPETRAAEGESTPDIINVVVNLQPKGDFFVRTAPDGDFWIKIDDVRRMGIAHPQGVIRSFQGVDHIRLGSISGVRVSVDNWDRIVSVDIEPRLLGTQNFDLRGAQSLDLTPAAGTSAYLNYRAGYESSSGDRNTVTLDTRFNLRLGGWLLQNQDSYISQGRPNNYLRLNTSAIYDWHDDMQRLMIGDQAALSGDLGRSLIFAGIGYSRAFQLQPNFISAPTTRFFGTVSVPSVAEIYVDGVRVRTQTINPGLFQFDNLNFYGGLRQTQIIIRDQFGRQQMLTSAAYFSNQLLRAGLHDYSYNAGFERQDFGTASNRYGPRVVSAYHRYGATDDITLGLRGDGIGNIYSAGPTGVFRVGTWGVVAAEYSHRQDRDRGRGGNAASVTYSYESRTWQSRASYRRFDLNYVADDAIPSLVGARRLDRSAGVGYNTSGAGSLSLDRSLAAAWDGTYRNATTLAYSVTLPGKVRFFLTLSRVNQSGSSGYNGFAGLFYSFDNSHSASVTRQKAAGFGNTDFFELSRSAPEGEGFGYRMIASNGPDGRAFDPFIEWNAPYAVFTGSAHTEPGRSGSDRYQMSASGALAWAGGQIAASRPIRSSFAIVKVGDLEGVRVSRNNQETGITGHDGTVLLPNLTSYAYNRISLENNDIPLDYDLRELDRTIVPPLNSGVLLTFETRKVRAYAGKLMVVRDGVSVPVEHVRVSLTKAGAASAFVAGYRGEFYLDGIDAGRYTASFHYGGRTCGFEMFLPVGDRMLTELPPVTAQCK